MADTVCILDGYIDEPDCLGVPPFVSPHVRYLAGLLLAKGYTPRYFTIDQVRPLEDSLARLNHFDHLFLVAGITVPGRYLLGTPVSFREVRMLASRLSHPRLYLVGNMYLGHFLPGKRKAGQVDLSAFSLACGDDYLERLWHGLPGRVSAFERETFIANGTAIVQQHPMFPRVILEIETFSGCPRLVNCSFCIEQLKNRRHTRRVADIVAEMAAASRLGCRYFRLGNQPDIFGYQCLRHNGGYRPNVEALKRLLYTIREQVPLDVLHTDNGNPAVIADYAQDSRAILEVMVQTTTPGNTIALGMESADPLVIRRNGLNARPGQVRRAVELINACGCQRGANGMPRLLPGINLISGLPGETRHTHELNQRFLESLLADGLLLRRINLRQVLVFPGTRISRCKQNKHWPSWFRQAKARIRSTIDKPMLQKVAPVATVLTDVLLEQERGGLLWGRQMGSYPLLCGIIGQGRVGEFCRLIVAGHGYRSITGLRLPADLNTLAYDQVKLLPGIGKTKQAEFIIQRPFHSLEDLLRRMPGLAAHPEWHSFYRALYP